FSGVAIGDKGFIDAFRHEQLARKRGVEVIAPPRKNMKATLPPAILRPAQRWRKRIETVISQLTERFDIEHPSP
ncbi:MAG: hypothetical protein GXP39_02320, partial [Chloroflexi bacterium]|nr:hypothetical protein [Chloroflexota bacterium]